MADVHDKVTRSYNMSRIRGSNTKPEMQVRRFLFARGFRYRLHLKDLPGKPDIPNREKGLVRRAMLQDKKSPSTCKLVNRTVYL